jgi:hypothetical protein
MILPGAISRPENPIVIERSSSPTTTYGSEGEFRRIVESFERNTAEPQETTETTRQIIEEQRDER